MHSPIYNIPAPRKTVHTTDLFRLNAMLDKILNPIQNTEQNTEVLTMFKDAQIQKICNEQTMRNATDCKEFARQYVKNLQQQLFLRKSSLVLKIKFTKV